MRVMLRVAAPQRLVHTQRSFMAGHAVRAVARPPPPRMHAASPVSAAAGGMGEDGRVYCSYDIYKGKAAVNVKPVAPTYAPTGENAYALKRPGGLLFEAAPASGTRTYDWSRKVAMLINVTELGQMLASDGSVPLEFVHDPNMGGAGAGDVMKRMRLSAMPDGQGWFLNLRLDDKSTDKHENLVAPLTHGEVAVLKSIITYAIPRLLGFDRAFASEPTIAPPGQ